MLGQVLEPLGQQDEGEGADHRARQAAEPAQDDHQQGIAGLVPGHQLGIDVAVLGGIQEARQPRQRATQGEAGELVGKGVVAGRPHAWFVVLDADQRMAQARSQHQSQHGQRQRQPGQREPVELRRLIQVDQAAAGQREGRLVVDVGPVAAAEGFDVVEHEVHQLAEGQRDHDEVDAARAHHQEADRQRQQRRAAHRRQQQQPAVAGFVAGREHRHRIRRRPEIGRMPQADESRVAHQQLQAQREDRHDQHLGAELDVERRADRLGQQRQQGQHRQRHDPRNKGRSFHSTFQ